MRTTKGIMKMIEEFGLRLRLCGCVWVYCVI